MGCISSTLCCTPTGHTLGHLSPLAFTDEVLSKYDKNKNGIFELAELKLLLQDVFPSTKILDDDVKMLADAIDTDGSGTVCLNEIRSFLRHHHRDFKTKSALVIIDVQNDFITGTLANPYNAKEIVPLINSIRDSFDLVVISYDWHPQEHCSFVESVNAGKVAMLEQGSDFKAFTTVTLRGDSDRPEHKQCLYPRHAVQGSEGGKTYPDLVLKESDKAVYKGTKPNIDSYSAFFDNCKANDTGLNAMLHNEAVTDVYCCGLVFDICVMSTALHGAELGYRVAVIEDACKPLMQDHVSPTKEKLLQAGVGVTSSTHVLKELADRKLIDFSAYCKDITRSKPAIQVHNAHESEMSSHARQ